MATCKPGYFGQLCKTTCPSGRYGPECGGVCLPKCPNEECDHVYGCLKNSQKTTELRISEPMQSFYSTSVMTTNKHFLQNSRRNIVFVTVAIEPNANSEFQAIHMLVGVGALISLFLCIIVIQLCKKTHPSNRQNVRSPQIHEDFTPHSESTNLRGYNIISEQWKDHAYSSFDAQYSEINESLEINIPSTSIAQDEYGRFGTSYAENEVSVSDTPEEPQISVDPSSDYLNPIFVKGEPKLPKRQKESVYINVIQD